MALPPHRLLKLLVLAPVLACGSSRGGSPTAPTNTTASVSTAAKCRDYSTARVTRYTFLGANGYNTVQTEFESCGFNNAAHVLSCMLTVTGDFPCNKTISTTYATTADFVEEAQAVGRERLDTRQIVSFGAQGCGATNEFVYTYDAQKRLVRTQADYTVEAQNYTTSTTFTAWDALSRPTQQAVVQSFTGGCSGNATITYDDAARTTTFAGAGCYSGASVFTRTYDASGNLLSEAWKDGLLSYTRNSTVSATAKLCL